MKRYGTTLLNYNFKGGVGKTTLTGMEAYILAKRNKKILLVDFDPQANLTQMMSETYNKKLVPKISLLDGLDNMDISKSFSKVNDNIDILPSDWKMSVWLSKVNKFPSQERPWILNHLLNPYRKYYDYIFIDVPPTLTYYVLNAIFAADGISIVLQTQRMSYQSSLLTAKELYTLRNQYHLEFNFLGVILYLLQNAKVDREITKRAKKTFSGLIYSNTIHNQERVKGFTNTGIKDKDYWDKRAIAMYNLLTNENIYRAEKGMSNND